MANGSASMRLPAKAMSRVCWIVRTLSGKRSKSSILEKIFRQNCGPSEAAGVTCFHGNDQFLLNEYRSYGGGKLVDKRCLWCVDEVQEVKTHIQVKQINLAPNVLIKSCFRR